MVPPPLNNVDTQTCCTTNFHMESLPRATTKRASKHRSSYTKELDKLKANLAEWKAKLDTDNAELKSMRENFIAGLS